jgi:TonB family protein
MSRTRRLLLVLVMLPGLAGFAGQPVEDSLVAARQLYAAASYDEALAMLGRLEKSAAAPDREIPLTRALCLVGLNRDGDARAAMAQLVDLDPRFEFDVADASPRVRDLLRSVRTERLPKVVQARYAEAKRAFDAGDFGTAATRFADVRGLLDDPLLEADAAASDLKTLTRGFADLSAKLREAASAAAPSSAPTPADASVGGGTPGRGVAPPAESAGASPRLPVGTAGTTASMPTTTDRVAKVVEPVALSQRPPEWPPQLGRSRSGPARATIMVVIDEAGKVTSARTVVGINPVYDVLLLDAARRWKYQPATQDGRPIPFTQVVSVLVASP